MPGSQKLWLISIIVSIVLAVLQVWVWVQATHHPLPQKQLSSASDVEVALAEYSAAMAQGDSDPVIGIPTGIYIQSLDFYDSTRVYLTGYIWQHFSADLPDDFAHWKTHCESEYLPFIFPDQVNSGSDIKPEFRYQDAPRHGNLCGWYFEVTLRQEFDYSRYPFDSKTVWLRLWTRALLPNVVLVPDLDAYPAGTGMTQIFGIDKRIVLNSWVRENTFFSYSKTPFDTTFGSLSTRLLSEALELNYNFVIKRKLVDAMVEHLLGIFVVMILLFATMLVVSRDPEKAERHGFNTSVVLGACSALFFVVLIAHIQIRSQFSGTNLVYMEMYYYLLYLLLIGTTINTYYFSEEANKATSILHYRDNVIPKLCYWPSILGYSIIVSLVMLF